MSLHRDQIGHPEPAIVPAQGRASKRELEKGIECPGNMNNTCSFGVIVIVVAGTAGLLLGVWQRPWWRWIGVLNFVHNRIFYRDSVHGGGLFPEDSKPPVVGCVGAARASVTAKSKLPAPDGEQIDICRLCVNGSVVTVTAMVHNLSVEPRCDGLQPHAVCCSAGGRRSMSIGEHHLQSPPVGGHEELPMGGHETACWWPRNCPR